MSEIISFRLGDHNPRESRAKEVLNSWVRLGFSVRHVITEALIRYGDSNNSETSSRTGSTEMNETVELLASLVEKLERKMTIAVTSQPEEDPGLRTEFVDAIKKSVRPGMRVDGKE